ncbi:MAG: 2'-deoxycytidine 5'-triphosphate deaminase, partial [Rhodospirillaceae bacterium]
VIVRAGARLNQLRLTGVEERVEGAALESLLRTKAVLDRTLSQAENRTLSRGVPLSVDLEGINGSSLVGYKAKRHAPLIDLERVNFYTPSDFWEAINKNDHRSIILDPDEFYILASREAVSVPNEYAAEMVPYDAFTGEFRAHYAGFFDPGFGHETGKAGGTRAVLEVRSYGVPFMISHGQLVGRLKYERLSSTPDLLYGAAAGSSYQKQGLKLSKHFKPWKHDPV